MNDWNLWAQQRKAFAQQSDESAFIAAIKAELEPYGDEDQGEALLALVSALRADLVSEMAPSASSKASQQVLGLLGLAENMLQDDPLPSMTLATFLFYDCNDPAGAYPHALRSVEKARRRHDMVRQCTGELIRLSIALGKYEEVEPLLAFLTGYEPDQLSMEIPLESDFLGRLPAGSVSPAVLGDYRARLGLQ
jgi:hypothetical protein